MRLIIDIHEDTYKDIIKNGFIYDEDNEVVTHVIKNGTLIPEEATNGDVLKMMFPNIENQMIDLVMRCGTSVKRIGNDTWMNLPYQKGK